MMRFHGSHFIFNVASESHVDRSITDPGPFIENNVRLITNVLEIAKVIRPHAVLQVSTDEVYGPAKVDHPEWSPILPSNPYSASKACQEAIAFSYWRTYGVPVMITNTMNIFGEMQDPEKFVPKIMRSLLRGDTIPVHVSADGIPGSRYYLHARNQADALVHLAMNVDQMPYPKADRPPRYNVVGDREVDNVEMVHLIAELMGVKPKISKVDFHTSRPGHDLRYGLDGSKIRDFGWKAPKTFEESMRTTVGWTLANTEWLL
jgi:dTDP-glucose 4,6-dehydratase